MGDLYMVIGTLTFPTANDGGYLAAGNGLDPSQFGLAILDQLQLQVAHSSADATKAVVAALKTTLPIKGNFDATNAAALIQAFWSNSGSADTFPEVDGTTDLSTYVFDFVAWGS